MSYSSLVKSLYRTLHEIVIFTFSPCTSILTPLHKRLLYDLTAAENLYWLAYFGCDVEIKMQPWVSSVRFYFNFSVHILQWRIHASVSCSEDGSSKKILLYINVKVGGIVFEILTGVISLLLWNLVSKNKQNPLTKPV